ncbi:2-keto-3-deoxygluconate kinase [Mobilisporobacter senegalensis]|uniref:2-keto-3-deoxygluconate kinase n=1 Tax=Mobilisporobacter senegalensis TaxID=1329262 RepID=A0A3N1XTR0_9FIRM|nr:sugar kinase [Mobilisporobacter senegalensis]ROR28257.1 2-keto-3-deoxygluconate kinase [Mobilisporobacter senegalensis]
MSEVILFGEPMALFMADTYGPLEEVEHFTRSLAGAEVNVCIGLTRLGHKATYITRLGDEPLGHYIENFLKKESIGTEFITYDPIYKTGFQLKSKVKSGDPYVPYYRKGSAASHMGIKEIDAIDFNGIKLVHITGIPPALSDTCREATYRLIERAKENHIFITFDPNLRPALWESQEVMTQTINDIASKCHMILPGTSEGLILMGSEDPEKIADFYQGLGIKKVLVKLGPDGAYVRDEDTSYTVPGFKVEKVVDTVGAGDGFAAGVISGLLENLSIKESVLRGNAIGSIQVTHISDNEGLPTRQELDEYIKQRN